MEGMALVVIKEWEFEIRDMPKLVALCGNFRPPGFWCKEQGPLISNE